MNAIYKRGSAISHKAVQPGILADAPQLREAEL